MADFCHRKMRSGEVKHAIRVRVEKPRADPHVRAHDLRAE